MFHFSSHLFELNISWAPRGELSRIFNSLKVCIVMKMLMRNTQLRNDNKTFGGGGAAVWCANIQWGNEF